MKLSEIVETTDGRTKENRRAYELLEAFGDCEVEYRELDYWYTDYIKINDEWKPLAFHFVNNKHHCSSLINYASCSAKEWELIFFNL